MAQDAGVEACGFGRHRVRHVFQFLDDRQPFHA
jgi:hypothetical protein